MLPTVASCIAATGGTLAALRAGEMAATRVTPIPSSSERMTVLALRTRLPPGRSSPIADSSALRPAATATPAASPISAAMTPDRRGLDQHRAEDLAPAGTQRPQQAVLPGALGDGDGERVQDDEGADQQGHHGEDEEELAEDRQALLERVLGFLDGRRPGHRLGTGRQHALQVADQLLLRHARAGDEADRAELAGRRDEPLRDRRGEQHHGRAGRAVGGAETRRSRRCAPAAAARSPARSWCHPPPGGPRWRCACRSRPRRVPAGRARPPGGTG